MNIIWWGSEFKNSSNRCWVSSDLSVCLLPSHFLLYLYTYYVIAHFHFILSLGAIISIFSVIIFNIEKIISSKNLLSLFSNNLSIYHFLILLYLIEICWYIILCKTEGIIKRKNLFLADICLENYYNTIYIWILYWFGDLRTERFLPAHHSVHHSDAVLLYLYLTNHSFGLTSVSHSPEIYNPNTWFSGIILFFLLMAIAFLGYILPFGQMSFWGATVITNLFSFLPYLLRVNANLNISYF